LLDRVILDWSHCAVSWEAFGRSGSWFADLIGKFNALVGMRSRAHRVRTCDGHLGRRRL
jgi:hypothetical protein